MWWRRSPCVKRGGTKATAAAWPSLHPLARRLFSFPSTAPHTRARPPPGLVVVVFLFLVSPPTPRRSNNGHEPTIGYRSLHVPVRL